MSAGSSDVCWIAWRLLGYLTSAFSFAALSLAHGIKKPFGCVGNTVSFQCNSRDNKWVDVMSIVPDESCGDTLPCTTERLAELRMLFLENCANRSLCSFNSNLLGGSQKSCTAIANFECIQGTATTPRVANTTPKPGTAQRRESLVTRLSKLTNCCLRSIL